MKGERIKVKNIGEIQEKLKREKKEDVVIKLIFLNLIGGGINFGHLSRKLCLIY